MTESSAQRAPDPSATLPPIRIAAEVISNAEGQILLACKRGSAFFIQPGGRIEPGESPIDALARELRQEVGLALLTADFFGDFSDRAVNEPSRRVEAAVFGATTSGEVRLGAEIEEAVWIEPGVPCDLKLAPLAGHQILPLVVRRVQVLPHE